jgi:hypothetical protein
MKTLTGSLALSSIHVLATVAMLASGLAIAACDDGDTTPTTLDISVCAPENGPFSTTIDNVHLPFKVGAVNVLQGLEGGTDQIKLQITVLDETQDVDGVTTRVVESASWEGADETPAGTQRLYVAQAPDGTVCFYGTEGAGTEEEWMAGEDGALPAILMPADPVVGTTFEVVHAPPSDVEAVEVTAIGDTIETPAATYTDTVTLLTQESGPTLKIYADGVGLINDDGVELVSTTY